MKNLCIVSAVGHYQNAVKYLEQNRSNDENYLIIFMYTGGVVPEKILTDESVHFWKKVYIFEPIPNATSGMNTVALNQTASKFKQFITDNDLVDVDELYLGVIPILPMYNYIPSMYLESKVTIIEDGTASYMLGDTRMFEYMCAPNSAKLNRNIKLIKKKQDRKENGLMLLNTISYTFFKTNALAKSQLKYKWQNSFHFEKLVVTKPDWVLPTPNIKFNQIEEFDFGNALSASEVVSAKEDIPIYFDQAFGIPGDTHVKILDNIFAKRGYKQIIVKLHPKSRSNYIQSFYRSDLKTKFIIEQRAISGEDLLRESCPSKIVGLNSTVLMWAKDVVTVDLILDEYIKNISEQELTKNYFSIMFMKHSSQNLNEIINHKHNDVSKLKAPKLGILGKKKYSESEKELEKYEVLFNEDMERSKYQKKIDKGVRNYLRSAMQIETDEKQIFFEAYKGMYACSPKEIYLYLSSKPEYDDYTFVWARSLSMDVQAQVELEASANTKVVNYGSPEYFHELAKSKLIITNQRLHLKFFKKDDQYVIQTWHGTPFKKDAMSIDISSHNVSNDRRIEQNHNDVRNYDYFMVQNEFSAVELAKTFLLEHYPDVEVLKTGYPRNNKLQQDISQTEVNNLKEKYGIPKDKKVLFYTPTWRDHHKKNKSGINDIFDFEKWKEQLSDEWVILFRGHYFHAKAVDLEQYQGFIYDTTRYNDINDFYLMSDILVTDYSSSYFDYLSLKKPIIFYMPDFVAYIKLSRKLHFEPEADLPGPVSYQLDQFLETVKNYQQETKVYMDNIDDYINEFCPWDQNANQNLEKILKEKNIL